MSSGMSESEKYEPLHVVSNEPHRNRKREKKTRHRHKQQPKEGNTQRKDSIQVPLHRLALMSQPRSLEQSRLRRTCEYAILSRRSMSVKDAKFNCNDIPIKNDTATVPANRSIAVILVSL